VHRSVLPDVTSKLDGSKDSSFADFVSSSSMPSFVAENPPLNLTLALSPVMASQLVQMFGPIGTGFDTYGLYYNIQ